MSSKSDYVDTSKFCPCGNLAIGLSRSSRRCARCQEIEKRNEKWLTNYHPNCSPKAVQMQSQQWWVTTAKMINRGYDEFLKRRGLPPMQFGR